MATASIRVEGLEEFRRGLRTIDAALGKELGAVNKSVGASVAAWSETRRTRLASQYPAYRSRIVKVKGSANQRRAQVTVTPAAAEFGTDRHPVFGTWRPQSGFRRKVWPLASRSGWLVAPTVADREPDIAAEYLAAVSDLAEKVIDTRKG